MLPDRVSNPGPLTYESGALPIALCGRLFSIGVADCLKKSCCFFFTLFTLCVFHELLYTSFPYALKDGVWGLSLRKSTSISLPCMSFLN